MLLSFSFKQEPPLYLMEIGDYCSVAGCVMAWSYIGWVIIGCAIGGFCDDFINSEKLGVCVCVPGCVCC